MDARALQLSPIQTYLEQLHDELLSNDAGEVASYIPELTRADPAWLGIALVTVDGHVYQAGDSRQEFTIQSISKAFTYGLALEDRGLEHVLSKVGVEPSGEAFNSISLEEETGRPMNPMINAGAIATTGLVRGDEKREPMQRILETFGRYTGREMSIDETVYRSESETGHRNRAIAHLLLGNGILDRVPEDVLDLYFRQCSINVTARDLAMMGACLANSGVNPVTGVVALKSDYVHRVLSVMSTCGMYDYSGSWIFNVGMPAKSGVGGGIVAVLPGQFGLGIFSPRLDAKGNSVRGIEACKRLSSDFSLNLFQVARSTSATLLRAVHDATHYPSRRHRDADEQGVLAEHGHRVRVYELQGDLMFGGTESVVLDMLATLPDAEALVVDLKRVVGADFASIQLLKDLAIRAADQGGRIYFTDCQHLYRLRKELQKTAVVQEPAWFDFPDTDHAVEWCENALIHRFRESGDNAAGPVGLESQYLCADMTDRELQELRAIGEETRFEAGACLFCAGDPADAMYFILDGEVEVSVATDSGRRLRLTTLGPGSVFGELALLNRSPRSADVGALMETHCLAVSLDRLAGSLRERVLVNMAGYFAKKIQRDTEWMQHLG